MGDTVGVRGSQASVVIRITEACFSGVGRRRPTCVSTPPNTSNLPAWRLFSGSRRHGIQRKGLGNGLRYTRTEKKWRPLSIGAWDANKEPYAQGKHWERRWIDTGFFCERTQNGNALLGCLYWASSAGYLFFDIGRESHLFIFDGYQYLFLFLFFTVPVFSPEGLAGADWWPSLGWEDGSRGLSHGMETGKGGKGRGVCFSPWVIPREPG